MSKRQRVLAIVFLASSTARGFHSPSSGLRRTGCRATTAGGIPPSVSRHLASNTNEDAANTDGDWPVVGRENASADGFLNSQKGRRQVFTDVLRVGTMACGCAAFGGPISPAHGLAQIAAPSAEAAAAYDLPRNQILDAAFAQGMAVGMRDYEAEAYPKKKELFRRLFSSIEGVSAAGGTTTDGDGPVVVEVGMGSFPNALYYGKNKKIHGLDIIGVDPNDRMKSFAMDNAERAKLLGGGQGDSLRIVHGVSEALPLATNSCDAVVCTLTLCSVVDPARSVAEIKRVLKPGGKFLFWEHVLSQTNLDVALQQVDMTPVQVKRADGCHLDRETGDTIKAAGFKGLDMEYLELTNFGFLNPTVCGIATA